MVDMEISVTEAAELLRAGKARLIDVREPWEFAKAAVEGAVLLPMSTITARAAAELDREEHLLVLCHHGARSFNVTAWLRGQGYEQAQNVRGGIAAWARDVDPSVGQY